jgi:hypothetical protein
MRHRPQHPRHRLRDGAQVFGHSRFGPASTAATAALNAELPQSSGW